MTKKGYRRVKCKECGGVCIEKNEKNVISRGDPFSFTFIFKKKKIFFK